MSIQFYRVKKKHLSLEEDKSSMEFCFYSFDGSTLIEKARRMEGGGWMFAVIRIRIRASISNFTFVCFRSHSPLLLITMFQAFHFRRYQWIFLPIDINFFFPVYTFKNYWDLFWDIKILLKINSQNASSFEFKEKYNLIKFFI